MRRPRHELERNEAFHDPTLWIAPGGQHIRDSVQRGAMRNPRRNIETFLFQRSDDALKVLGERIAAPVRIATYRWCTGNRARYPARVVAVA